MGLVRTTLAGMTINFTKDTKKNCINCNNSCKKIFRNKYECGIVLGLNLDDGTYGYCGLYEVIIK